MEKHNQNKNEKINNEDILDGAEKIGNLAIKAHDEGGMPLVFALVGAICLVMAFIFVILEVKIIWPVAIILLAVVFFVIAIYLATYKKKDVCPKCKGKLVIKKGKFGKFYGCINYPTCDFTKDI